MKEQKKKLNIKRVLWYYWQAMEGYRTAGFFAVVAFSTGTLLSNIVLPIFYKRIIDVISTRTPSYEVENILFTAVGGLFLIAIGYNIAYRIGDFVSTYFESNVLRHLQTISFKRIQDHSYNFFTDQFSGSLIAKKQRFVRAFDTIYKVVLWSFWSTTLVLIGVFISVFILVTPIFSGMFLLWSLFYLFITYLFVRKKVAYDIAKATMDSRVTGRFSDVLGNMLTVKMFAMHAMENQYFQNIAQEESVARSRAWNFRNWMNVAQGLLILILQIGGMYLVIRLWLDGTVSAGVVVLVQAYFAAIFAHLWNIGNALAQVGEAFSDAQEMVEIFDQDVDVQDPDNPEKSRMIDGSITFHDVNFSYDDNSDVLRNLSLTIPAGQKVGLVGTSGAGKSTVTKLLLRFADVTSGKVTIDGQDVRNVIQDDLRSRIAYVPQEPLLFHRSIRENIAYARPEATDEEIVVAAQMAHAHGFIGALPEGYDTLVGERGVKLSGGERQRVAIARAILKDAPVLVMDEATSALDSVSEAHIQAAMEELVQGRTAIVVAHRLSTLKKMDRIIVMERGRIVEDGTHEELLAREGQYALFWKQQAGGFVE